MSELFIAIQCEELPARFINTTTSQLSSRVQALLKGIPFGTVRCWSAPRHVAVAISDVAPSSPVQEKLITGPPVAVAYKDGVPTKTALGFARGKKVAVEDLEIVESKRGPVIGVRIKTGGEKTIDRIAQGLQSAILGIDFPKTMSWGTGEYKWARPIHHVIALYNEQLIATSVAGIETTKTASGHRLFPETFEVNNADEWVQQLQQNRVEVQAQARRTNLIEQLKVAANNLGATIKDWDLVDEVVNLVEWPIVITSTFPEDLLDLPPKLLVESMKLHQRTFPLYKDDRLLASFLAVTNQPYATDPKVAAVIADGNKRVLTARFYDAKFFYAEDKKTPLPIHGERLKGIQWIRKGGTVWDKSVRIKKLAAGWAHLFQADQNSAARAAELCKNDLTTQMVIEFPKLQGHVGRLLALETETETVANAIEQHYMPLYSGAEIAHSPEGRVVACADRWDTLVGCFSLGLKPKGSGDPLGLRRAANGLLATFLQANIPIDLKQLCAGTSNGDQLLAFLFSRLQASFADVYSKDLVNAVFATGDTTPVALQARLEAMAKLAAGEDFGSIRTTFKRVMGLTKEHTSTRYDPALFQKSTENVLHDSFSAVQQKAKQAAENRDYETALFALGSIKSDVDNLFDSVMVMVEDESLRNNRLGLLRSIADAFRDIADFTLLSTE